MLFSKKLIDDFNKYFHKKFGIELTDTEANAYLEVLGSLGLVVFDSLNIHQLDDPRLGAGAGDRGPCEPPTPALRDPATDMRGYEACSTVPPKCIR